MKKIIQKSLNYKKNSQIIINIEMSTNYRVTRGQQFYDINNPPKNDYTIIDQLGIGFKKSVEFVWGYLKTIDVKNKLSMIKSSDNKDQSKDRNNIQEYSLIKQKQNSLKLEIQRRVNQNKQPSNNRQTKSKKELIRQKKESKKVISFSKYEQEQAQKLNQSFIRKNIETKKIMNRSMITQQQNSIIENNQQRKESHGSKVQYGEQKIKDKQHIKQNNSYQQIKSTLKLTNNLPNPLNVSFNNNSLNNLNESILNLSDITSQCNFNILNNQNNYQANNKLINFDYHELQSNQLSYGQSQNNIPALELTQYPFIRPNKKLAINKNKLNKYHHRQNNNIINYPKLNQPQFNSQLELNSPQYIDVDNLQIPYQSNNYQTHQKSNKRQSYSKYPQTSIRKQIKSSYQSDKYKDKKIIQKIQKFDQLLQARYQKLIQESLSSSNKNQSSNKQCSLKQQYQKFVEKNFGAHKHIKKRLQNHRLKKQKQDQSKKQQQPKFSQILKPIDTAPSIDRKKLYTFTKQCESKISIKDQLRKSVMADKQKQIIQQIKRKQQQQALKRKLQQQKRKLQEQLQRKKRQQEEKIKKLKEQETKKLAEQQNNQQQNKQSEKAKQINLGEKEQSTVKQINSSKLISDHQANKKSPEQTKPQQTQSKQNKSTIKPFSLFAQPQSSSLFGSIKPKDTIQLKTTNSQDAQKKEDQPLNIKKSSSFVNVNQTLTDSQKALKSGETVNVKQSSDVSDKKPELSDKKPSTPQSQKPNKPIVNPFTAPTKPPKITKLQQIINSSQNDSSLFKTIINTPPAGTSSTGQPIQPTPNPFLSPVRIHNTSHHSILDSSMCDQDQPTLNGAGSQLMGNQNPISSFLNNSFTSNQNTGLFNTNTQNPLFNTNPSFNQTFNSSSTGLFGQRQNQIPSTGLFNNQPNMFTRPNQITSAQQAVKQIPSFMQKNPASLMNFSLPGISGQNAASLFSQRSPTKGEPQPSLFGPAPTQAVDRKTGRGSRKDRIERIK